MTVPPARGIFVVGVGVEEVIVLDLDGLGEKLEDEDKNDKQLTSPATRVQDVE